MKKIKILYTIPNFDTAGSGKALLNLALGLDKEKFEPHILCLHNKGEFFKTVEKSGIPVYVFDYIPKERPIFQMLKNCFRVSKRIKEINPDIVHSFHYSSNYSEALSVRLSGKKWVFTKKNMSWGGSSKNSWKLRSFFSNKIILQNSDMNKFYPNSKKTALIPRGVNIEKFHFSAPNPEIKSFMRTEDKQRVLICVANFVPVKGIEILIKAYDKLKDEYPDWSLWLVGDDKNEYGIKLHELVKSLELNTRIIFSGKQMNIADYLNHSEIFVLPTLDEGRREGSPVALLEAMANSKVVLGSKVPGIKDQLNSFPEHLFTPKREDELAKKLSVFMSQDKDALSELGKNFYNLVSENYSIEIEIKKHEEFYLSFFR
ncbi:glycosyltransferase [Flavobacterium sp. PLA-1-15]|uniref:glycosyltransferase n=1 Tax=Flavobacterium sp. PLA-1-15 TaxID=3380533 RepID=UPI003B7A71D4